MSKKLVIVVAAVLSFTAQHSFTQETTKRFVLRESSDWTPYFQKKNIIQGSVLDLSSICAPDAPAGKYGWLKAVGDHFEFEKLPGKEQRFLGVNLCNEANYPEQGLADTLVTRFVRMGYNSIRIHHYDNLWRNPANQEKLDYFLYKAIEAGMYITTDLYVSRKVKYKDMGIDKPGTMSQGEYKALVSVSEIGFKDWCDFAGEFLNHVNPHTGRAYKDEPALCLISLVNEGCMEHQWKSKQGMDEVRKAWKKFGGPGEPKPGSPEFSGFSDQINESTFAKCSEFVRSIGCKALLTNDNNGRRHAEGADVLPMYDYVDKHIYVRAQKKSAECKASAAEKNHPAETEYPWYFEKNSHWGGPNASKPYTFSEWRHCFPAHKRALSGILGLAYISAKGIDGLWPFAYAENYRALYENPSQSPRSFDLALDGIIQGLVPPEVFFYRLRGVSSESQIHKDKLTHSCSVIAENSEMLYADSGTVSGSFMNVEISGAPSVIFVGAVDGNRLCESVRMLLTHLTDIQGNCSEWNEEEMVNLMAYGTGQLIRAGRVSIHMHVSNPSSYSVYEVDGSGKRSGKIETRIREGNLVFDISTNGPNGGRMYYEIFRE